MNRRFIHLLKISGAILPLFALIIGAVSFLGSKPVNALTGSDFKAGRIIDDYTFFNSSTMTSSEIQTFLNAKVPTCDTNGTQSITYWYNSSTGYASASTFQSGSTQVTTSRATYGQRLDSWRSSQGLSDMGASAPYTCLKSYVTTTPTVAADTYCDQINGGSRSAAQLIAAVSSACHINPQSLIVTIQKEQGLVTDDWPWKYEYKFATGFCVYDTTPPPSCSGTDGFFNQVYYAARQFQRYIKDPNRFSFFNYFAGQTSNIPYSPTAGCGSASVYIQNNATAGLYNYTPYQPNPNVLKDTNPTGSSSPGATSDGCATYGNRNFWWYFNTWFGSTIGPFYYQSSKIAPPTQLEYGGTANVEFKIVNNSTQTWYSDGHTPAGVHPFRLMTWGYQNTPFADTSDTSWLGTQNQVKMVEASVAPGGTATFDFRLKAPRYSMSTNIIFVLVQDGVQVHADKFLSMATTSVPDYAYQLVSMDYPRGILPGDAYKMVIKLKNTGEESWYSDANRFDSSNTSGHPIRLATSGYHNSPYAYPNITATGWLTQNQIRLVEPTIAPGQVGTFQAIIYSPYQNLNFTHNFRLVLDGVKFIDGPSMPVTIFTPQPITDYKIISRTSPSAMRSGETATIKVVLQNTGNIIWRNIHRKVSGTSTIYPLRDVRMMSWAPPYHTSAFWAGTPEWINSKNQITSSTPIVSPGDEATYIITFKAPPVSQPTFYNEQWNLVLDGQVVFPFHALTFPITVSP